jgi:large subunit ribosomal protein L1
MATESKRYKAAVKVADLSQAYGISEAIGILEKMPKVKFNETIELSANLGVDPKQGNQTVRGTVILPNGSGKKVVVAVFTENPQEALDAGADYAGLDDLLKKVQEGWMDFDVAVSTTSAMKVVRTVARVLGPRGLMPNPKSGTVTDNIPAAIKEVKAGRVEFKMDKAANISVVVGKRSFTATQLEENFNAVVEKIAQAKPDDIKGRYVKSMTVSSTMSPGVKIDPKVYSKI